MYVSSDLSYLWERRKDKPFISTIFSKNKMPTPKLKIKNKITKTFPKILHCPADEPDKEWNELCNYFTKKEWNVFLPEEVSIITFNNREKKCLEKNLDSIGLNYHVLGKEIKLWSNTNKIRLLSEFLPNIKTKYVLVMDADDVLVVRELSNLINEFEEYYCEILFNASNFFYPETEDGFYKKKEDEIVNDFFNHLNSGCFLGKTVFVSELYNMASSYQDEVTKKYHYSDQIIIKKFYVDLFPKIKIDHKCNIFQIFHSSKPLSDFIEISTSIKLL